jgi:site-specific recombinase XerD
VLLRWGEPAGFLGIVTGLFGLSVTRICVMEETMGKPISKVAEVFVPEPLGPFAAGFKSVLMEVGFTPLSAVNQLRLMVHLSRWLDRRGLATVDLTTQRIEEYLDSRRAAGYRERITHRGLAPLLDYLQAQRALPANEAAPPLSAAQRLLTRFERYLRAERGLSSATTAAYVARTARFLADQAADGVVGSLTPGDVTGAVLAECEHQSVGAGQYFVAAVRSFLRFCHVEGLIGGDLSAAALAVTGRRQSLLPQGISASDTAALLKSCDRRRAVGRRDHAVMLLLLRLGLRAGEVAGLHLEDIDWRAGELVVRGKGQRLDRLPLPVDVGDAVAGYLRRGRPTTAGRQVFMTVTAPIHGLTRGSVSLIVRRGCARAGIQPVGAHRLRHTMACAMVRHMVPLGEIGQVLRHRSPVSTAGYARVDLDQLRTLAQPWPATTVGGRR